MSTQLPDVTNAVSLHGQVGLGYRPHIPPWCGISSPTARHSRRPCADARGPSAFWFGMADAHSDWQLNDHVHQATGMIAEQLNCDVSEALARLKIRA